MTPLLIPLAENPLLPAPFEIVAAIVFALLLWFLIAKYVVPGFEKTYAERTEAIQGGIEKAERAQAEAAGRAGAVPGAAGRVPQRGRPHPRGRQDAGQPDPGRDARAGPGRGEPHPHPDAGPAGGRARPGHDAAPQRDRWHGHHARRPHRRARASTTTSVPAVRSTASSPTWSRARPAARPASRAPRACRDRERHPAARARRGPRRPRRPRGGRAATRTPWRATCSPWSTR